MLMHHTLDCAKSRWNPESHWLVNGSWHFCYRWSSVPLYHVCYHCS